MKAHAHVYENLRVFIKSPVECMMTLSVPGNCFVSKEFAWQRRVIVQMQKIRMRPFITDNALSRLRTRV